MYSFPICIALSPVDRLTDAGLSAPFVASQLDLCMNLTSEHQDDRVTCVYVVHGSVSRWIRFGEIVAVMGYRGSGVAAVRLWWCCGGSGGGGGGGGAVVVVVLWW